VTEVTTPEERVPLEAIATGVPGLDFVIGGGLPRYSFNIIAGAPGTGKTTLAHQIMFANASPQFPALYFTILGEPPLKMLRYQQQFAFFDPEKVADGSIRFLNLGEGLLEHDLQKTLKTLVAEVERVNPGIVVVDSFRTVLRRATAGDDSEMATQSFLQRLAVHLTTWQATTFLIGEYADTEVRDNPVFTVADGILWAVQSVEGNSMVRKLQVMKMRGQAPLPGVHTFRMSGSGVEVFPRVPPELPPPTRRARAKRVPTGVAGLDAMMNGGPLEGDSILLSGASGSGKSVLAGEFIWQGLKRGEPGVIAVFEENPEQYLARAADFGFKLDDAVRGGTLEVISLRTLDLSVEETLREIERAVARLDARRLVIDSLSGFEMSLAANFRSDLGEALYRTISFVTRSQPRVTTLMTVENTEAFSDLRFSPHAISFLADDLIIQRFVEIDGQLRRVLAVPKMRGSKHSLSFHLYEVTNKGLVVGETLQDYRGIITGVPVRTTRNPRRGAAKSTRPRPRTR
jgi:circadian clock protein KaiC